MESVFQGTRAFYSFQVTALSFSPLHSNQAAWSFI